MKHGAYDYISKPFKPDEVLADPQESRGTREPEARKPEDSRPGSRRSRKISRSGTWWAAAPACPACSSSRARRRAIRPPCSSWAKAVPVRNWSRAASTTRGSAPASRWCRSTAAGFRRTLLESELFGYKKGAFTGADRNKKGLFQEADGGTIFLDEIGELPLSLQVKLLRVLQESEVRPVGEAKATRVDVRVIAATGKHLDEEVRQGRSARISTTG